MFPVPALPCPALLCPALPCLALPCLALPCLALPCLVLSCPALPSLASCPVFPPTGSFCCLFCFILFNKAHLLLSPRLIPSPQPVQNKLAKRGLGRDGHFSLSVSHHWIFHPPDTGTACKLSLLPHRSGQSALQ